MTSFMNDPLCSLTLSGLKALSAPRGNHFAPVPNPAACLLTWQCPVWGSQKDKYNLTYLRGSTNTLTLNHSRKKICVHHINLNDYFDTLKRTPRNRNWLYTFTRFNLFSNT